MSLRIDVISVGAAFQSRLNNYGVRVIYFRGWPATSSAEPKPLPQKVGVNLAACGGTFFDRINKIFFYFYPEYPV